MFEKITQTTEHLSLQYQHVLLAKVYHSHIQYLCSVLDPKLLKAFMGSRKGHRGGGDCAISTSLDENTSIPDEVTASKDRRCGSQKQSFYSLLNPESLKAPQSSSETQKCKLMLLILVIHSQDLRRDWKWPLKEKD